MSIAHSHIMFRRNGLCLWFASLLCLHALASTGSAQTWDLAAVEQNVPEMQNEIGNRLPLLVWTLPELDYGQQAVTERSNGVLSDKLGMIWARGYAPYVWLTKGTAQGRVAFAMTLQDDGLPIHTMDNTNTLSNGLDLFYPNDSMWFTWSDNKSHPIFPQATPSVAYFLYRTQLENLQQGGVTSINGFWLDYEKNPWGWNDNWYANKDPNFPAYDFYQSINVNPSVLSSKEAFIQYGNDLREKLFDDFARQAVLDVFNTPSLFGNYGWFHSSEEIPYDENIHGVRPPRANVAAQPQLYPATDWLNNYFAPQEPILQNKVDDIYWRGLMRRYSTSAANDAGIGESVPWVCSYIWCNNGSEFEGKCMSLFAFREFLKHVWLRGADGMAVFTYPEQRTAPVVINDLASASVVMDEMLNYREFLDSGVPMTYDYDSEVNFNPRTVWSGLKRDTDAIVHVTSFRGSMAPATFEAFWQQFSLTPVPDGGATYYINDSGDAHRVDPRPYSARLHLDQSYTGDSPSQLVAWPAKYPSSAVDASFIASTPGAVINSGVYGFVANHANSHSIQLSRDSGNMYAGNWVAIPNTAGVFNASSFTAEMFVNLQYGNDVGACIMGKVSSAGTYDWRLSWDGDNRLGLMVNLVGDNNTSKVWLRSISDARLALGDGWHHLAVKYDDATQQIQLYLDYELLPWQYTGIVSGSQGPENDGTLPTPIYYRSGDAIRLGYCNRAINAWVDEFRFSPEALDPYQFLRVTP